MDLEKKRILKKVFDAPEKHVNAIEAFKTTYEGLQIGEFSTDVIADLLTNGTINFEQALKATATDQIEKSGITSPLLKANLLKSCDEVLKSLNDCIDSLILSYHNLCKKEEFDRITAKQMRTQAVCFNGHMQRVVNAEVKALQIGVGGGIQTECGKSIDVNYGVIRLTPGVDTYYIYFIWPRTGGKATIASFTEPKSNTDTHFYIFWKSGTFEEIPF